MKEIKITEAFMDESILLCPECNGPNMHHDKVEIFDCGEDEEEGTHVVVEGDDVKIDKSLLGNPSPRRHGLKISFWCEKCNNTNVFILRQHKGNSFVGWITPKEEQEWLKDQKEERKEEDGKS